MATPEEIISALGDAVKNTALPPEHMIGRFALVVEMIEPDGRRPIYTVCPQGQMGWESLGLLTQAVHLEQAAAVRDYQES